MGLSRVHWRGTHCAPVLFHAEFLPSFLALPLTSALFFFFSPNKSIPAALSTHIPSTMRKWDLDVCLIQELFTEPAFYLAHSEDLTWNSTWCDHCLLITCKIQKIRDLEEVSDARAFVLFVNYCLVCSEDGRDPGRDRIENSLTLKLNITHSWVSLRGVSFVFNLSAPHQNLF